MKAPCAVLLLALAVLLSGCTALCPGCRTRAIHTGASTSLVDFLYPKGGPPPADHQNLPVLPVPLRVGLSFLPERAGTEAPDPAQREQILERIAEHFKSRGFIGQIVIIPDYYLQGSRGFEGLAGIERLYGVDVMALVSYDQVGYQDDTRSSIGYLTIVGAYFLHGTREDVTTLVDLAVVDPNSRTLLLRAGGTDTRARNTALIGSGTVARNQNTDSLNAASTQLIEHFDVALTQLEADIKAGKSEVQVTHRAGYTGGGGAFGLLGLSGLALAALFQVRRRLAIGA
jgi:rhombotail lipoprotein